MRKKLLTIIFRILLSGLKFWKVKRFLFQKQIGLQRDILSRLKKALFLSGDKKLSGIQMHF